MIEKQLILLIFSASGRPDVQRATVYSSHRATSAIDDDVKKEADSKSVKGQKRKARDDDEFDDLIGKAMQTIVERRGDADSRDKDRLAIESERLMFDKERLDRADRREEERLQIERERAKREMEATERRLLLDQERNKREAEDARLRLKAASELESLKQLETYNRLSKSDDELERAYAKKMKAELIVKLGLTDYM